MVDIIYMLRQDYVLLFPHHCLVTENQPSVHSCSNIHVQVIFTQIQKLMQNATLLSAHYIHLKSYLYLLKPH